MNSASRPVRLICFTLCVLLITVWFGCHGRPSKGEIVARAGSQDLSQAEFEALTGISLDSLSPPDQWRLAAAWVERALVEQEGKEQGFDKDSDIQEKLQALRAELYRAKLLAKIPAPPPDDELIASYYDLHRDEFLRHHDAYLIELYWSEDRGAMADFRRQLVAGDTTLLTEGRVAAEGKWLAESGELETEFEAELASLKPGEVTFPRPYEDGFRAARLLESFPAGTVLDLPAVRDEIAARLVIEQSRQRMDSLDNYLRQKYPVTIFLADSL
ncbi:MAG: peptidyl-prolyl cis-trans isomerase [Calditrichota bacterium]